MCKGTSETTGCPKKNATHYQIAHITERTSLWSNSLHSSSVQILHPNFNIVKIVKEMQSQNFVCMDFVSLLSQIIVKIMVAMETHPSITMKPIFEAKYEKMRVIYFRLPWKPKQLHHCSWGEMSV